LTVAKKRLGGGEIIRLAVASLFDFREDVRGQAPQKPSCSASATTTSKLRNTLPIPASETSTIRSGKKTPSRFLAMEP